ncbi:MAG: ribosome maturation factor RimM [Kiloniellales bacterium]
MAEQRICVGAIVGAHGVRGLVRVKSYTAVPEDLVAYGLLGDEAGERSFTLHVKGRSKGLLLAAVEGVADRDAAQALAGTRLYLERTALPELAEADEFYQADLIGLEAVDKAGRSLGRVKAVHNFGAGDLLEIEGRDGDRVLPFTKAVVPEIDLAAGRLVVVPPAELEAPSEDIRPDEEGLEKDRI